MRQRKWLRPAALLLVTLLLGSVALADDPPPPPEPEPGEEGDMEEEGTPILSVTSLNPIDSARAALAWIQAAITG